MIHKVILPKLGVNLETATIVKWIKTEGDKVNKGDILVEVETAKAIFDVEAESEGVLRKIISQNDDEVDINTVIAIIADERASVEEIEKLAIEGHQTSHGEHLHNVWHEWKTQNVSVETEFQTTQNAMFTPAAKRLLNELNLDKHMIAEKISKDIITEEDIRNITKVKRSVIYGGGIGVKQTLEITRFDASLNVIGIIDDDQDFWGHKRMGVEILGGFEKLKTLYEDDKIDGVILSFHSDIRRILFNKLCENIPELQILTVIDPRSTLGERIKIGKGVFVEAGTVIGPDTVIDDGVIIDLGAVVCHDNYIGKFSHLSPGCSLSGTIKLKENVLVGVGACINSTVTIGRNVIITPGSAVMNDLPDQVIVSGVPAQVVGQSKRGK